MTCFAFGFCAMNCAINFSVDGLASVLVRRTTCLPLAFASATLAFIFESTSPHDADLPAILGCLRRMLSYNDKTDAWILALAGNLAPGKVLFSILIGRPSRV